MNRQESSLCSPQKTTPSATRRFGRDFVQVRFASRKQMGMSNARLRSANRTGNCDFARPKVWENLDAFIAAEWAKYHSAEKAAMYGPWDIPEPELPAYSRHMIENLQTTRQFVSNLIAPLTRPISAPLYARVPPEHRGVPSAFVSHTWSSTALAQAHGSLDIVLDHYLYTRHSS